MIIKNMSLLVEFLNKFIPETSFINTSTFTTLTGTTTITKETIYQVLIINIVFFLAFLLMFKFYPKEPKRFMDFRTKRMKQSQIQWEISREKCYLTYRMYTIVGILVNVALVMLFGLNDNNFDFMVFLIIQPCILVIFSILYVNRLLKDNKI